MIALAALMLTVPPPDWRQPIVRGPGLMCGVAIAYALGEDELIRIGFPGNPWDGTFGHYSFDLNGRSFAVWERREAEIGEIVGHFSVAGSPFDFRISEYRLIAFPVDGSDEVGEVEVAFGPDPLTDTDRAAYLARFVTPPADRGQCLEASPDAE